MQFSTHELHKTIFIASSFKGALKILYYEEKDHFRLLSCGVKMVKLHTILPGGTFFGLSYIAAVVCDHLQSHLLPTEAKQITF